MKYLTLHNFIVSLITSIVIGGFLIFTQMSVEYITTGSIYLTDKVLISDGFFIILFFIITLFEGDE